MYVRSIYQPLACLVFLVLLSGSILAQEPGVGSLAEALQAWEKIAARVAELKSQIDADQDPGQARAELKKIGAEAKRAVAQLEAAAKQELESDRTSGVALRALMGRAVELAANDQDAEVLELGEFLIRKGINPKYFEVATKSEKLNIDQKQIFDELLIRQAEALKNDLPRVELTTTQGKVVLELFENEAPQTVGNFISLAEKQYFDGMLFHRVIEDFMAQSGGYKLDEDNQEQGGKGPGYEIRCECFEPNFRRHFTGSLSMAKKSDGSNRGTTLKHSAGSEFFITLQRTGALDGEHTVFGRVLSGFALIESLARTHTTNRYNTEAPISDVIKDKILSVKVLRKRDHPYAPTKFDRKQQTSP